MRKLIPLFTLTGALLVCAQASAQSATGPVAQVIVYDVAPEAKQQFIKALESTKDVYLREPGFLNERVLDSLDPLALKYLTYARFTTAAGSDKTLQGRLAAVAPYVRRTPEVHIASLTDVFTPAAITSKPKGTEFGIGKTNHVAHLGLFVPFPQYWEQYKKALYDVKVVTRGRKPVGYLGDDLLLETTAPAPDVQAPYSPRAVEAVKMSINYGEYETLEAAENSYVQRHGPIEDPRVAAISRIFYGSLQVPARFYIFRVIANYGPSTTASTKGRSAAPGR